MSAGMTQKKPHSFVAEFPPRTNCTTGEPLRRVKEIQGIKTLAISHLYTTPPYVQKKKHSTKKNLNHQLYTTSSSEAKSSFK